MIDAICVVEDFVSLKMAHIAFGRCHLSGGGAPSSALSRQGATLESPNSFTADRKLCGCG
jgi:hypothetical protein